ncbi:metallophosphoesterase family protein [Paenibacillus ferrarius]|uniref:metallophosphoesterase family protein n=1 Tax=Paenibacillus ferrarius TaxID=1469647 RepID=UPI00267F895D
MKFQVITDTHVQGSPTETYSRNFNSALQDISTTVSDSDGIMHIGDITDSGALAEYNTFSSIWNLHKDSLPPMHVTVGNHDVRWADFNQRLSRFTAITGVSKPYYDLWIKGYHFIFLGTEKGLKDSSYLSETQLKWLDEKLSENEARDKPIFIFHHQPLKNTVAGANVANNKDFNWYGVRQDRELKTILSKHPQSILFSGHTHWELGSKDTMYNAKYATMFNCASAGYLWTDNDIGKAGSQGFFVEVYNDKVLVKGRDFLAKSWIPDAQYVVALPAQIPVVDKAVDPDLDLGNPTMQLDKKVYQVEEPIQVTYTGSVGADAFGIFARGTVPSETSLITPIASINTNTVCQPDGVIRFNLRLAPGCYEMIYLGETMNTELTREAFEVVSTQQDVDQGAAFKSEMVEIVQTGSQQRSSDSATQSL